MTSMSQSQESQIHLVQVHECFISTVRTYQATSSWVAASLVAKLSACMQDHQHHCSAQDPLVKKMKQHLALFDLFF